MTERDREKGIETERSTEKKDRKKCKERQRETEK